MHKLFFFSALSVLALLIAGGCGDDAERGAAKLQLADGDTGRTITLAMDDSLVVSLSSNPSTGFGWSVHDPLPATLRMENSTYVPPATKSPLVGAAGAQVFTFRTVGQGTATLTLDYARPFEAGVPPEKTWTVTVIVE